MRPEITAIYASISGILFFVLSVITIRARRSTKIGYGRGDKGEITRQVSAHDNFSSYTPMILILLYTLESIAYSPLQIHFLGICLILGRILHSLSLLHFEAKGIFTLRVIGMVLTFVALLGSSVRILWSLVI